MVIHKLPLKYVILAWKKKNLVICSSVIARVTLWCLIGVMSICGVDNSLKGYIQLKGYISYSWKRHKQRYCCCKKLH